MQGRCGGRSGTRSCQVPTGDLLEPGSRHELSRRDTVGRSLDSETAILPRSRGRAFPGMFGIELAVTIMDGADLSEHRRKELALALLESTPRRTWFGSSTTFTKRLGSFRRTRLVADFTAWAYAFACPTACSSRPSLCAVGIRQRGDPS